MSHPITFVIRRRLALRRLPHCRFLRIAGHKRLPILRHTLVKRNSHRVVIRGFGAH